MSADSEEHSALVLDTTRDADSVLVTVAGELDAHTAPSLEALADELHADGCVDVTLDLSQTTFIDSAGLRSLIAMQTELQENGQVAFALRAPSDPVVRLLEITGLGEHFTVR